MQLNLDNSKYYNELVSYFWESFESLFYWNQSGAGAGAAVRPLAEPPKHRVAQQPWGRGSAFFCCGSGRVAEPPEFWAALAPGLTASLPKFRLLLRFQFRLQTDSSKKNGPWITKKGHTEPDTRVNIQ